MSEINKKLPIYDLLIDDEDDTVVNFISLVKKPAIDINWVAMSSDVESKPKKQKFKIQNADKRILSSAVMVPDTPIYRRNEDTGEEYYVTMSKETIQKAVKKFFKNGFSANINQNHNEKVSGAYVIESWFTTAENDKSKQYGYELPEGSWFATIYIENEEYWNEYIKTGELQGGGFSIEGMFRMAPEAITQEYSAFSKEEEKIINEIAVFLEKIEKKIK